MSVGSKSALSSPTIGPTWCRSSRCRKLIAERLRLDLTKAPGANIKVIRWAQERQLSMTATRETIEITAGEVASELKRRGIGSDEKVTLTIEWRRRWNS